MPITPAAPTCYRPPVAGPMGPDARSTGRTGKATTSTALAALSFGLMAATVAPAAAQAPPSFQQYPLEQRIFGPGGALFPDYSNPSVGGITYYINPAPSGRGVIFASGTADFNCQQTQVPQITVLSAPPGGKVSIQYGRFLATNIDGGASNRCLGQELKGLVVHYKGRAAPGATVTLKVTYPTLGAWYVHTVPVHSR